MFCSILTGMGLEFKMFHYDTRMLRVKTGVWTLILCSSSDTVILSFACHFYSVLRWLLCFFGLRTARLPL